MKYIVDNKDYLMHAKKGEEMPDHKYTSREWKNGSWVYNYGEQQKSKNEKKIKEIDEEIDKLNDYIDSCRKVRFVLFDKIKDPDNKSYKKTYQEDAAQITRDIESANKKIEELQNEKNKLADANKKTIYITGNRIAFGGN